MATRRATKTPDPLHIALPFHVTLLMIVMSASALAEEAAPLIKRIDDPTRAKVLAALAGLIILGFAMVLLAWLGARFTQRYRRGASYFRPTTRPGEHDWTKKPLPPPKTDPRSDL